MRWVAKSGVRGRINNRLSCAMFVCRICQKYFVVVVVVVKYGSLLTFSVKKYTQIQFEWAMMMKIYGWNVNW